MGRRGQARWGAGGGARAAAAARGEEAAGERGVGGGSCGARGGEAAGERWGELWRARRGGGAAGVSWGGGSGAVRECAVCFLELRAMLVGELKLQCLLETSPNACLSFYCASNAFFYLPLKIVLHC